MLDTLISSKTRIKLLLKFFLNTEMRAYLRGLEAEFGESSNAIRVELNRLEEAGMLESEVRGNKKFFTANKNHPLFTEVRSILMKHVGIDKIIDRVIHNIGTLEEIYLTGTFARGIDSPIIDLIFVGEIDSNFLLQICQKLEKKINRKIRTVIYTNAEFNRLNKKELSTRLLLLWKKENE